MDSQRAIEEIEKEIDASFGSSELLSVGYSQAAWTLLSVNEDHYFKHMHELSEAQMHVYADIRLNALTHPLRVCLDRGPVESKQVRHVLVDGDYQAALDWLQAAEDYTLFCTIFPLWHRRRVGIEIAADRRLIVVDLTNAKKEYEAYNRLVQGDARPDTAVPPPNEALLTALISSTTVGDDWFKVNFNPQLVAKLITQLARIMDSRHTLPENWQFNSFNLAEYRRVFRAIQAMLYGWYLARSLLANNGLKALGYKSAVWVVEKSELANRLGRYANVEIAVVRRLLDLITFGSNNIRLPDVATQPLIDLKNGHYALAPFVWLNSNMERNLCVLLNQIPAERDRYAHLTNEKEAVTKQEITAALTPYGFDFKSGRVEGTDLDLAIIDRTSKVCLCLELKWFIEPAEVREIEQRTQELQQGVSQAKKIKALFASGDEQLIRDILQITPDYAVSAAVASVNWIGFGDVQDNEVPIIKVWHLLSKIKETGSLAEAVAWLQNREYLPREGIDYELFPIEIESGKRTATWYGIKPVEKDPQNPL